LGNHPIHLAAFIWVTAAKRCLLQPGKSLGLLTKIPGRANDHPKLPTSSQATYATETQMDFSERGGCVINSRRLARWWIS
jgi:hypothetical protein